MKIDVRVIRRKLSAICSLYIGEALLPINASDYAD